MQLINKSLEGLLSELAAIKREATGRLSQVKSKLSATNDQERIRQTKVSRFVLKRVAELELESFGMRDEMARLFELQRKTLQQGGQREPHGRSGAKQEDFDFDEAPASTSAQAAPSATTTTSTAKPNEQEEAAQIGFDLEKLKRLGEEIGKRLDQFGKEAAKNLGELVEGIKLVFRDPNASSTTTSKPALRLAGC